MPTETAPQPPVAAPAAVPAPVATPPAAPELPINSITGKPIQESTHKLFKMLESASGPLGEDKPEPTPEKPAATPPPAAPVEPEKPIKVSKKPAPKRPDLPVAAEAPAAPAAPAPVASAPAAAANWEDSLLDEEKTALEDARFAETVDPKHKGLAAKTEKFLKDQKAYLESHPDADENDPGYKKILATQPTLSVADKRAISTARIKSEVTKEHEGKFTELQQEIFVRDEEPKLKAEAHQIRQHLAFNALPKPMLDMLKEKGLPALQKEYADELEVAGNLINTLVTDAEELLRITRVNPRTNKPLATAADAPSHPKWEQHNRIATLVNEVCNDFQKTAPQSEQVRDGKWFVTRDEWSRGGYNKHPDKYWTFTNSEQHVREMINRAMGWMPEAINKKITERQEFLKQRGYERRRADATPPPSTPPVATTTAPSPRPGPAPAPNNTPAGQLTQGQLLARRLAGE
jgi:hypothetical protein